MVLSGYGISIDLPAGWEGRLHRDQPSHGMHTTPVLHAGNFPLPRDPNTFGTSILMVMPPDAVFLVLVEYDPADAREGLFAHSGLPRFRLDELDPRAVQVGREDLAGRQRFFTVSGRTFCLYLVIGREGSMADELASARSVLSTLRIEPLSVVGGRE